MRDSLSADPWGAPVRPKRRLKELAFIMPFCGAVLFLPPYISIFNQDIMVGGIPFLHVALFSIWIIGIILTGILARRLVRDGDETLRADAASGTSAKPADNRVSR